MLTTSQVAFIQLQERKRERSKVIVTGIFAYIHCGQRPLLLTRESIPDSVSNSHTHNQYRPFNFKKKKKQCLLPRSSHQMHIGCPVRLLEELVFS